MTSKQEQLTVGRWVRHFLEKHEESLGSVASLMREAKQDHPTMTPPELMELIHNRQHTSLDWDAGHPEEERP